jgi:hypothetical protein
MKITNRFEHRWVEADLTKRNWIQDPTFNDNLFYFEKNELDENGELSEDLVVKHYFYCCATTPFTTLVYEVEDLMKIFGSALAGDIIEVWSLSSNPQHYIFRCPNKDGLFPTNGAY